MLGWQIFVHSVRMVFGNIKQVLQITVGPALIATVLFVAAFLVLGVPLDALDNQSGATPDGFSEGTFVLLILLLMFIIFFVAFWIAVSWHRYILLEEYPSGILPVLRTDRILAYFGRILLLGLIMILGYIPLAIVLVALSPVLGAFSVVLAIPYVIFLIVVFYRLSIILPAAAIGTPISLSEAWNKTAGSSGAILLLLIVATIFQLLVQLVFTLLAFIPILGVLLTVFFGILVLPLINISMLTTMYGVFVEKRQLS